MEKFIQDEKFKNNKLRLIEIFLKTMMLSFILILIFVPLLKSSAGNSFLQFIQVFYA